VEDPPLGKPKPPLTDYPSRSRSAKKGGLSIKKKGGNFAEGGGEGLPILGFLEKHSKKKTIIPKRALKTGGLYKNLHETSGGAGLNGGGGGGQVQQRVAACTGIANRQVKGGESSTHNRFLHGSRWRHR